MMWLAVLGEHSKYQQVNRSASNFCKVNFISVATVVMESMHSLLVRSISLTTPLAVGGM